MNFDQQSDSVPHLQTFKSARHAPNVDHHFEDVAIQPIVVSIVDGDAQNSTRLRAVLEARGYDVQTFPNGKAFLAAHKTGRRGCLLVDTSPPGTEGFALIKTLKSTDCGLATIAMAPHFSAARAVESIRAGASDCLELPIDDEVLVRSLEASVEQAESVAAAVAFAALAKHRVSTLTARQCEILDLIVAGHPSKNIAADLDISQRTVENHRAAIARKTCAKSMAAVVHSAICANCHLMNSVRSAPLAG